MKDQNYFFFSKFHTANPDTELSRHETSSNIFMVTFTYTKIDSLLRACSAYSTKLYFILPSLSGGPYHPTTPPTSNASAANGQERARVLYDYDARDSSELSVMQDEVTKFVI